MDVTPGTPLIPVVGSAHSIKHSMYFHYIERYIEYSINHSMFFHYIEHFIEWIIR